MDTLLRNKSPAIMEFGSVECYPPSGTALYHSLIIEDSYTLLEGMIHDYQSLKNKTPALILEIGYYFFVILGLALAML